MPFVNLTPHALNVLSSDGEEILAIEPSGSVVRVSVDDTYVGDVGGVPTYRTTYGEPYGLPDSDGESLFIVSGMVAAHPDVKGRDDVLCPGPLVRDENGRPVGCKGLRRA